MRVAKQFLLISAIAIAIAPAMAAPPGPRSGKAVVDDQCAVCHATGLNGAPRIGDAKAWAPRAQEGLSALTQRALEGVRKMPPHGGKLSIPDLEIRRAITYMVNQSGGRWAEPIDRRRALEKRSGESIVQGRCVQCHGTGVGGAPKVGDQRAWVGRAKDGFDSLVQSAIRGHGQMPARGGMADLTDAEMRDAVAFRFERSAKKEK